MENLKSMVDVNTIVGDPVETPDGSVIVPISRVSFGFAAGGTEWEPGEPAEEPMDHEHPFGGGSGGGVSVQPVAFLVVGNGDVRLLPVDRSAIYDRVLDMAPQFINQLQAMMQHGGQEKNAQNKNGQKHGQEVTASDYTM